MWQPRSRNTSPFELESSYMKARISVRYFKTDIIVSCIEEYEKVLKSFDHYLRYVIPLRWETIYNFSRKGVPIVYLKTIIRCIRFLSRLLLVYVLSTYRWESYKKCVRHRSLAIGIPSGTIYVQKLATKHSPPDFFIIRFHRNPRPGRIDNPHKLLVYSIFSFSPRAGEQKGATTR